ncbi:MAG: lipoprotein-releasing system ATP-binding protein LolD [Zetaproteobacteria bacterium]|nr:lipoprotein-releasing system ATP-binding protein LolD [Pseudobdellovibrionaceae bacterium]
MSVRLRDIHKVFLLDKQKVSALKGVNLNFSQGSQVAITGRSGAGKSTLLHILGTLERPSQGSLFVGQQDVSSLSDLELSGFRNKNIGFVFQMNNLLSEFSALENVMIPGLIGKLSTKHCLDRAWVVLKAVGLEFRAKHRPGELSGGEQQRVAIARALFMSPKLLLADEPTGNLDKKTSLVIQDLLLKLCDEYKMTMLLVTHDIDLAKRLPKQILMEDGRIIN